MEYLCSLSVSAPTFFYFCLNSLHSIPCIVVLAVGGPYFIESGSLLSPHILGFLISDLRVAEEESEIGDFVMIY